MPMTLLADFEIRDLAERKLMIQNFIGQQVKIDPNGNKIVSYGLSSFGYDVRCIKKYKIFTNVNNSLLDPKNPDERSFIDVEGDYCIIPPNSFILTSSVEYFNMPPNVSAIVLGKSTYARLGINCLATPLECGWCFTGDTKVALANTTSVSFRDMVDRYNNGERFFGYTITSTGAVAIAELLAPRKIKENASLVEVTLDNDEKIRCTPEHEFLTLNNGYVKAIDLTEGIQLAALYRYYDKKGYESVSTGFKNNTRPVYTYKLSDDWNIKHNVYQLIPNRVRHHVDFNNKNNYPTNIVKITDEEHHVIHETKEGYHEERRRIAREYVENLLKNNPNHFKDLKDHYKNYALKFWYSDDFKAKREKWLRSHKEPRPYKRLKITKEEVYAALKKTGSIIKAAKELLCGETSMYRSFNDVLIQARADGIIPTNHRVVSVKTLDVKEDVYCLQVDETHNFALEAGVFVHNCGNVTLEFSNNTPLPVKFYGGEGCCQVLFFEGSKPDVTYAGRNGKYQGQTGITLAKV